MASGLVLIDKPQGFTSHDVVAKMRGIAGTRRVGHAGTLDPMATGLLLLGINAGTKLLTFLVGEDKTYEATIRLGASTLTDDAEGEILAVADSAKLSQVDLRAVEHELGALRGEIMQVPSSVSAIKVDGQRAYAKVRSGDEVKLAARPVTVSRFDLVSSLRKVETSAGTFLDFDAVIDCSSGTYIRALARDLGNSIGVGAHLTALRRTRIGRYSIGDAKSLSDLSRDNFEVKSMHESVEEGFDLLELSEQQVIDIRHGKRISAKVAAETRIAATHAGEVIAILEKAGSQLKSTVVFASEQND
jgi:tRNA pseudouridine55 synthase